MPDLLIVGRYFEQMRVPCEVNAGGGSEVKRAMHICRGHFVTYTEDNPLFGKHVGTFWMDMHVRGRQSPGKVQKTYSVKDRKMVPSTQGNRILNR